MAASRKPPKTYSAFIERFPEISQAWDLLREGEARGGLDDKTLRLVKLGIAVGGMKEGAVHSGVRKALEAGVPPEQVEQVIALAASTLGLPSTVSIYSWVREQLEKHQGD